MKTFIIGLAILLIGGFFYRKVVERIFKPDDRATPAVRHNDGVDFVPMSKWKNALINLLNIAGTGPIFGPIQGILFGPIAFITIPIGCVISGAVHDYLCGMVSMRENGAQMPGIIRKFLGNGIYRVYALFVCVMMTLAASVFTYTPGDLFATQIIGFTDINVWTWVIYGVILLYYVIATIFPIDKIIGRVYPVFGVVLLLSALGILFGIFHSDLELTELSFANGSQGIFGLYPLWNAAGNSGAGTPFLPAFFVTVACGITSGFHSTQCTLISRSVRSEKDGVSVFYWPMILEGLIALIWAAAAMGVYNAGFLGNATETVGEVAQRTLGSVGAAIAIWGVIILPITSGDTTLRSCRLMIADFLHIDQSVTRNRIWLTLCIFVPVSAFLVYAKINPQGFNVIWKYFAWANQTITVFAFAASSVYLLRRKRCGKYSFLITLLPGTFYMFIITSFILSQKIGFGIAYAPSCAIAAALSVLYFTLIIIQGKKHAANSLEE